MIKIGLEAKKERLRNEFIEMGGDKEQQEVMNDWETTVDDGLLDVIATA
jgi:hypothetical protein